MKCYNFIACDEFDLTDFDSIEGFVNRFQDFQSVSQNSEVELRLLLKLVGVDVMKEVELNSVVYKKYWDLSHSKLPEFSKDQYDQFLDLWTSESNRDKNFDEFGSLLFLHGLSPKWNKLKHRLIIEE